MCDDISERMEKLEERVQQLEQGYAPEVYDAEDGEEPQAQAQANAMIDVIATFLHEQVWAPVVRSILDHDDISLRDIRSVTELAFTELPEEAKQSWRGKAMDVMAAIGAHDQFSTLSPDGSDNEVSEGVIIPFRDHADGFNELAQELAAWAKQGSGAVVLTRHENPATWQLAVAIRHAIDELMPPTTLSA